MPKASLSRKDAAPEQGFGFKEGWGEITAACATIFQFRPNKDTGVQSAPMFCAELTILPLNEDLKPRTNADDVTVNQFKIDKGAVESSVWHSNHFRPGQATSRTDTDPKDLGDALGTQGNTVYCAEPGAKIHPKVKWMIFAQSLEAAGYKPEILAESYFPDLVGLVAYFQQTKMEKVNQADEKDPLCLTVRPGSIKVFPYEQATPAKGKAEPSKKSAPSKANGAVASTNDTSTTSSATANNTADSSEADGEARLLIMSIAGEQSSGAVVPRRQMYTKAVSRAYQNKVGADLGKEKMKALHDAIGELVKNDAWLADVLKNDASVTKDSVTFN